MNAMQIVSLATQVLLSCGVALGGFFLVLAVVRHVEAGLTLIALLLIVQMSLRDSLALNFGINLYPDDFVYLLIAPVAVFRMLFVRQVPVSKVWLAFGFVLFLSFLLGAARYGTTAGVQYRTYFYAWSGCLYAMTFPFDARLARRLLAGWLLIGCWVELAACLGWVSRYTGVTILADFQEATRVDELRVIGAPEALQIADATIVAVLFAHLGGWIARMRSLKFLWIPSLITLQHRSVWLAVMTGLLAPFGLRGRDRGRVSVAQVAGISGLCAAVLLAALFSGRGLNKVADSVGESARRGVMLEDTANWRIVGWQQLLAKWSAGGPVVNAVGFPFGSDMSRYEKAGAATIKVEVAAHNGYVQTLYNSGIVGLGLLLVFLGDVLVTLLRAARFEESRAFCGAFLGLLVCQLVFYIAYGLVPMQFFLVGAAYAYVKGRVAARATVVPTPHAAPLPANS